MTQKLGKWKNKKHDLDHAKYIATQDVNKLTAENITTRLKQVNLATKADINGFIEKTNFDNKLKHLNKEVNSNKTKHVVAENELHELSKKVEQYQ